MRKYAFDGTVQAGMSIGLPEPGLAPPWTPPVTLPDQTTTAGTATLVNTGTYETPPTIRINGPGKDLVVLHQTTGMLLSYDVNLGLTDYLLIDVAAGVALLNGVAVRSPLAGSSVTARFMAVPGENVWRLFGTATDAVL